MGREPGPDGAELAEVERQPFRGEGNNAFRRMDDGQGTCAVAFDGQQRKEPPAGGEVADGLDPPRSIPGSNPVAGVEGCLYGHVSASSSLSLRHEPVVPPCIEGRSRAQE
jgi:hypothetical protein